MQDKLWSFAFILKEMNSALHKQDTAPPQGGQGLINRLIETKAVWAHEHKSNFKNVLQKVKDILFLFAQLNLSTLLFLLQILRIVPKQNLK